MVAFLAIFFFLYGLMHAYILVRAGTALELGLGSVLPLAFFMVLMIWAPIIVRLFEKAGLALWARIAAFVGYAWMGLVFLIVTSLIIVDFFRLVVLLLSTTLQRDLSFLTLPQGPSFRISLLCVALVGLYGWFEARAIRTERIVVHSPKVSAGAGPLRIVQISDVHLGLIVRQERLKRIMEQVRKASPDVIVSTGDLVDGQMNDLDGVASLLDGVKPRYGMFAVTGNHEFYAGLEQALAFTRRAGFRVLHGEAVTVPGTITIVGVDDPSGPGYRSSNRGEGTLLSKTAGGTFTLFLKHRPDIDPESTGLFDLQLSGHLHDGQIFPFRLLVRLFYPHMAGLRALPGGSLLYVSRGSGTWGPPIRFLAPPEVTIIDLVNQDPSSCY
jgi:predicted MPP superfamily phosphohydrolase